MSFGGEAKAVAVDSQDRVYAFNRGSRAMPIFKAHGSVIGGWGDGEFVNPHAITVDADDNVFLVDSRGGNVVQKRTREGELLMLIGTFRWPAARHSGAYFHARVAADGCSIVIDAGCLVLS